jgi:peptidoglycan/xylan/chitin deacetylase (PgdA/CDA1 family)
VAAVALAACKASGSKDATVGSAASTATTDPPRTSGTPAPPTTPPRSAPSPAHAPAQYIPHGPRTTQQVALTFHASGDPSLATELLDVLEQHHVAVTVFGVGQWLEQNPELGARIGADGHEHGNHTQTHQAMGTLSAFAVAAEITQCADVLQRLTGSISSWFRPSGIDVPTAQILVEAGKAGYPVSVGYDVDALDFQDPGATAVVANVRRGTQGGSIVSLHFGHRGTIQAVPAILDHLGTSGLRPVTVGQLLA